jgi:hypothetical protein
MKKIVWKIEMRLRGIWLMVDGCEDLNDDKLDILGWWKSNALKYKILSKVAQHVQVIPISTMASESAFSTQAVVSYTQPILKFFISSNNSNTYLLSKLVISWTNSNRYWNLDE